MYTVVSSNAVLICSCREFLTWMVICVSKVALLVTATVEGPAGSPE